MEKLSKYSTHLTMLMKVVAVTTGPVLELGVGSGSTPALNRECAQKGRMVVSCDSDRKYLVKYADEYASGNHSFRLVGEWASEKIEQPWDVVLVDHRPAWRRRLDVARLANCAQYIVVHDTEPDIDRFYRFSRIWKYFRYIHHDQIIPRTTVLSNFHPLDWLKDGEN